MTEPDPGTGPNQDTTYTYSPLNQLLTTMTRGTSTQARSFSYDSVTQRLSSMTMPETGTTSFTYNSDGSLLRRTDAKGQKTEYTYDALGRVTLVKHFATGSSTDDACQRVTYSYDTNTLDGDFSSQAAQGRLTNVQYGGASCPSKNFSEMYSYTSAGLVKVKRLRHTRGTLTNSLEATFTYDNEGRLTNLKYPIAHQLADPNSTVVSAGFSYSYDNMGRPSGLTEQRDRVVTVVSGVTYGPADEITGITYLNQVGSGGVSDTFYTETRQYNARLQPVRITVPGVSDLEYRYSLTQNDGQATGRKEYVSGEDVTYQYDNLQRLISAVTTHTSGTAAQWGQSFTFDGFGNLTGQSVTKGSAPYMSLSVDGATNRLLGTGFGYDANGNMTSLNSTALGYDVENRLVSYGNSEQYAYDPANHRVWRQKANGDEEVWFWGPDGRRLANYRLYINGSTLRFLELGKNVYFAGRAVRMEDEGYVADTVGSAVSGGRKYYPFGAEIGTATADEKTKFATYYRDGTGLDYANQRYYTSQLGRFVTPDGYLGSADPSRPQSWNRYSYVEGDPANFSDPSGQECYGAQSSIDGVAYGPVEVSACDPGSVPDLPPGSFTFAGSNGWNSKLDFTYAPNGYQDIYESGGCSTSDGRPCYEVDIEARKQQAQAAAQAPQPTPTQPTAPTTDSSSSIDVISAWSVTGTVSLGPVGAALGAALAGPVGLFPGYAFGSMFGAGLNVSYTPSTGTVYVGPVLSFSPVFGGGAGLNVSGYIFPTGQSIDATLNGLSGAMNWQPLPIAGSTVTASPGQAPVAGPSIGTKVPISITGGYNWCILNCP